MCVYWMNGENHCWQQEASVNDDRLSARYVPASQDRQRVIWKRETWSLLEGWHIQRSLRRDGWYSLVAHVIHLFCVLSKAGPGTSLRARALRNETASQGWGLGGSSTLGFNTLPLAECVTLNKFWLSLSFLICSTGLISACFVGWHEE